VRRSRGLAEQGFQDFGFGEVQGRGGGEQPQGGIGKPRQALSANLVLAAERGADGVAQDAENARLEFGELAPELRFRAALFRSDGRKLDLEFAAAGFGRGRLRGGHQHRTREGGGDGAAAIAMSERAAGGQLPETGAHGRAQGAVVLKAGNVIVPGGFAPSGRGAGQRQQQVCGGIDERAQHPAGSGFAAAARAVEEQDRIRGRGAKGGEEPGQGTDPGAAVRDVEEGAEPIQVRGGAFGGGRDGLRERLRAGRAAKEEAGVSGAFPAAGGEGDGLALAVVEVEVERAGMVAAEAQGHFAAGPAGQVQIFALGGGGAEGAVRGDVKPVAGFVAEGSAGEAGTQGKQASAVFADAVQQIDDAFVADDGHKGGERFADALEGRRPRLARFVGGRLRHVELLRDPGYGVGRRRMHAPEQYTYHEGLRQKAWQKCKLLI
jgi:hypothetical protein